MARRKAISPVIATVIIVAVTIAVAIAVAFWMTGIVGLFTAAEKLEITSALAQPAQGGGWEVILTVKNTGTTPTSIDLILINGVNIENCDDVELSDSGLPLAINPGGGATITINIGADGKCGVTKFTAGLSIEVKLHSTGGKEYPRLLTLP